MAYASQYKRHQYTIHTLTGALASTDAVRMPCYCMVARYDCVGPNSGRRDREREREIVRWKERDIENNVFHSMQAGIVWRRLKQFVPFAQPFRPHQIHFGADVPEYCFVSYGTHYTAHMRQLSHVRVLYTLAMGYRLISIRFRGTTRRLLCVRACAESVFAFKKTRRVFTRLYAIWLLDFSRCRPMTNHNHNHPFNSIQFIYSENSYGRFLHFLAANLHWL